MKGWLGVAQKIYTRLGAFFDVRAAEPDWLKEDSGPSVRVQTFSPSDVASVLPYRCVEEAHHLFVNGRSTGFGFELSPMMGATEEVVTELTTLLTEVLSPGTDVQWLMWASPQIGETLASNLSDRARLHPGAAALAAARSRYYAEGTYRSLSAQSPLLLRHHRLFCFISKSKVLSPGEMNEWTRCQAQVRSLFESLSLACRSMAAADLLSLTQGLLSAKKTLCPPKDVHDEMRLLHRQAMCHETSFEVGAQAVLAESESRSLSIRTLHGARYPERAALWQMDEAIGRCFDAQRHLDCPYLLSLHVHILPSEAQGAKAQWQFMSNDKKAHSPLMKWLPDLEKRYRDWAYVRERLHEGDRLVKTLFQVVLFANPETALASEQRAREMFRTLGWQLEKSRYLQWPCFLSTLPFAWSDGLRQDLKPYGLTRTMTAANSVNIAPLLAEWQGNSERGMLLVGRRGQVATWDPFVSHGSNYNMAVIAPSGSGKSVFTQEYIVSLLARQGRVWIFDKGHSYQKLAEFFEGEFIQFDKQHKISLNPFSNLTDIDSHLELLVPLIAAMAHEKRDSTDEELIYIEKGLKAIWQVHGPNSTITHLVAWLKAEGQVVCDHLAHTLYSYSAEGMHGHYFEGPCTISLDNPLTVIELQGLSERKSLRSVILYVLMYHISQAMYHGERNLPKSCIIDEAWDLLGEGKSDAAQFIQAGFRTARRHEGNFVTISQHVDDFQRQANLRAAFSNVQHRIVLGHTKPTELKTLFDKTHIDPHTERLFASFRTTTHYSEGAIINDAGVAPFRLMLDPASYTLYSTKGKEFEAVRRLQAEGLTIHQAVAQVAGALSHA